MASANDQAHPDRCVRSGPADRAGSPTHRVHLGRSGSAASRCARKRRFADPPESVRLTKTDSPIGRCPMPAAAWIGDMRCLAVPGSISSRAVSPHGGGHTAGGAQAGDHHKRSSAGTPVFPASYCGVRAPARDSLLLHAWQPYCRRVPATGIRPRGAVPCDWQIAQQGNLGIEAAMRCSSHANYVRPRWSPSARDPKAGTESTRIFSIS